MPTYLSRLRATSTIRLNRTPFKIDGEDKVFSFFLPGAKVSVTDRFEELGTESVPSGIWMQVEFDAPNIDTAISTASSFALPVMSILCLTSGGAIDLPLPIWTYDVTTGLVTRDCRFFLYDPRLNVAKRQTREEEVREFWMKLDAFLNHVEISDDWKSRLFRAIHSYRRALADAEDVLSEFLTVWSSLEGLDCVYRGVYPARNSKFMDGVRDIFARLNLLREFSKLKDLRDGVAHGFIDLNDATKLASTHIEDVRKSLRLMVTRIIQCDENLMAPALARASHKGSFVPHCRLVGTINIDPPGVNNFDDQPQLNPHYHEVKTTRNGDKLDISPGMRVAMQAQLPGTKITLVGHEIWGDANSPMTVSAPIALEVQRGDEPSPEPKSTSVET